MEERVNPERGRRLRALREAAGISQRELARQLETHHSNVGFWERTGTAPRGSLLPKMARTLGVSVEEILGSSGDSPKRPAVPGGRVGQVFGKVSKLPRRQQKKILDVVEAFVAQTGDGNG